MPVKVYMVDVADHRDTVIRLITENLAHRGGESHLDWLYVRNPWGKAKVWLAEDVVSGECVGLAAAFPREVYTNGERHTCWNLGDFAVCKEFRSLGPAVALQRACLKAVLDGHVAFAYDHPHSTMLPIYRWMKIQETGSVVRYAKPLRIDGKVRAASSSRWVDRGVSKIGNLILRAMDLRRRKSRATVDAGSEIDERFDALDQRMASSLPVVGRRNAAYLRWRYLENPHQDYQIVTAAERNELRGYAVLNREGVRGRIVDLYADPDPEVQDALLDRIVGVMREAGAMTVSLPTLASGTIVPVLERWGFRPRETAPFVATTAKGGPWDGVVTNPANWFLTTGDRDV